jgi:hypothetical protein
MWNSKSSGSGAGSMSGPLIAVLFVVVAALIFLGVFLLITGPEHFVALLTIGFLALLFGAVSYLAESISKGPSMQRALSWGFGAFGFAVLFLTVGALPLFYSGLISTVGQVGLLIVLVVMLIVPVAFFGWRARGQVQDSRREEARHQWTQSTPPSAFSYSAARDPAAPTPPPADLPPRGGN